MADGAAFRSDLLARLTGYRIRLRPLRQRREDLGLFLADVLGQRRGADGCRLTIGVLRALLRHDWPTNVRGLEQTITRALVTSAEGVIDVDDVVRTIGDPSVPPAAPPLPSVAAPAAVGDPLRERLVALMREHHGNVAAVARAMGKARMQIQRWIKRYRLVPGEYRG
jgi:DNA-binding NtrC family response regulator